MPLYTLDPMQDGRWDDLVASHPKASVFHRKGWLRALAMTYGYRPIVATSTPAGEPLSDGIAFCEIKSWITGSRLVSLPFADHCEPLAEPAADPLQLAEWIRTEARSRDLKYVELRPLGGEMHAHPDLGESHAFWFHTLSLAPTREELFSALHKSCIQRRIRHAKRAGLSYERGCSESLLDAFYRLLMITRRRHQLLPQPRVWFRNLLACMSPDVEIRLVSKDDTPVSAILTLRHRGTVVYKYGCSDERHHHLAGMPFLFWKLIEESKSEGFEQIDFGRTDMDNAGLTEFKDRFGTVRSKVSYFRYPQSIGEKGVVASYLPAAKRIFSMLPDTLSSRAGRLAYRHIG